MENKIKETQKRAVQYWFSDGLAELSGAAIGLILALYFAIQQILPQASFALIFLLLFIASFGIRRLMLWYRERSTYPRTGLVEPKKGMQDRRLLGAAVGFSFLLLGFMIYTILQGIQTVRWMPVIGGAIFAFIFTMAGYRTQLARFYFLGAFCLLLGIALAICGLGDLWGTALLSLCTSLVLLAFGLITRAAYLHQNITNLELPDEP
jgi:MFS family permease